MREYKFRGKRIDNGEWVYGYLYEDKLIGCNILQTTPSIKSILVEPETVGQFIEKTEFTFDKDGNVVRGKKIFDGDIIEIVSEKDGNGVYLVFWDDGKNGWNWKHISGSQPTEDYVDAIKIIGNIHDNPELLEEKK